MSDAGQEPLNIYQRINEVRKEISYLQKDAEVQGYKVITHDAVTAAVRPHFIEHGVMVVPEMIYHNTVQNTEMFAGSKGTPVIRFEATFIVRFINVDNPEERIEVGPLPAHALDMGDKAPGKAISYAVKYAMLKLLSIETGEDDEGRVKTTGKQSVDQGPPRTKLKKAYDSLSDDLQIMINDLAEVVNKAMRRGHVSDAYRAIEDADFSQFDPEVYAGFWFLVESYDRAALKRYKDDNYPDMPATKDEK